MIRDIHDDSIVAIVNLGHAEYIPKGNFNVIHDPYEDLIYEDLDTIIKDAQQGAYAALWYDDELREWGQLARFEGQGREYTKAFNLLANDLDVNLNQYACSGDDDAFDYWPSGMRLLWEMAVDLNSLDQAVGTKVLNRYWQVLDNAILREWNRDNPMLSELEGGVPHFATRALDTITKLVKGN